MRGKANLASRLLCVAFLLMFTRTAAAGCVIYVDADATGANDGSSWENAYVYLQDALADANTAQKPVEIRVAQGIYTPDHGETQTIGKRTATFQLIDGVTLEGGYGGFRESNPDARDINLYETILSGDLNGDDEPYFINNSENCYQVVVGNDTDETAVLEGFTISAGNADLPVPSQGGGGMHNKDGSPNLSHCTFTGNTTNQGGGGGMYNENSSPIIRNCDFTGNITEKFGGGMYNEQSNPRLFECTFSYNDSEGGGGIYNGNSSPVLDNCSFIRNTVDRYGGGIYNTAGSPRLIECTFIHNLAGYGGGIYNYGSSATLNDCKFLGNTASSIGGGVQITKSTATLTGCVFLENEASSGGGASISHGHLETFSCTFVDNQVLSHGGGIYNMSDSNSTLTNCQMTGNVAGEVDNKIWGSGGGFYNSDRSNLTLTNCLISSNHSTTTGAGFCNERESSLTLINSIISGNITGGNTGGYGGGGGIYHKGASLLLINCIITGNVAMDGHGGGLYCRESRWVSEAALMNCTFVGNSGQNGNSISCNSPVQDLPTTLQLTNCILWNRSDDIRDNDNSTITITYSNVYGGWPGEGNIDTNPLFVDADGADNIVGTEDDDLRLSLGSPCIGAGDNSAVLQSVITDLDGNPRIVNGIVDMGAYEGAPSPDVFYYVDAVSGDNNNYGLTAQAAFATIQKGIDAAEDSEVVLVYPGLYQEEINFLGKRITVQGVAVSPAGVPVLQNSGDFAVSFYNGEGPDSILKNFIIKDSFMGVLIVDSSPTLSNMTIVNNKYGIEAYADSEPDISNTILWNNTDGDLFGCRARYSCLKRGGEGNITDDPLFVYHENGDYHLRSERGRYWPEHDLWVLDKITSPCIDAGDPQAEVFDEPMPHGGRINIGAYGGTSEASLSPGPALPLLGQATIRSPIDGEHTDELSVILTWIPGENADSHDVYFSDDYDTVANATTESTGIYRGRQPLEKITYDTGVLELNKTYYWRIDEIIEADPGNPSKGDVWSFTTAGFIVLDDFEGYDEDYRIWRSWQDSLGYGVPGTETYVPGNDTGAAVGDETVESFMETFIVHSGRKSLPYSYDNNKPGCFNYSEATMILDNQRNWMKEDVEVLSLWFYGDPANIPELMYMAVANSNGPTAVVYYTDPDAVLINNWTEWTIELREFADQGINLNDVNSIAIGFGDRDNPQPGGSGKMYFDDIRLLQLLP
jgi:hypothetical protein